MPRIPTPNYTFPNLSGGIDESLVGTVKAVPSFIPFFLMFVFGVIFIGGVVSQKRRTGTADFPMWATVSSLATFMVSLPLTLVTGIISVPTLATVITITIVSGLWLFLSRGRFER